jgi:uncharacterized protein YdaU (DUF1376 family)
MSEFPMMPFYPADFLASTAGWSTSERGLYLVLLFVSWLNGPLPNDEKALCRIAGGFPKAFSRDWKKVSSRFVPGADTKTLVNRRNERERYLSHEFHRKKVAAGRLGGLAKAQHTSSTATSTATSDASILPLANGYPPSPSPSEDLRNPSLPSPSKGEDEPLKRKIGTNPRAQGSNPRAKNRRRVKAIVAELAAGNDTPKPDDMPF